MKKKMNDHYTFELLDSVTRTKVHFTNHFGIELTGDVYAPKSAAKTGNAALAVCGPFGAVKEQASGLYAMHMASRGFVALAFDPSYCGESGGVPRYMNSPDINTEDFMAAVDFLSVQQNIDAEKIGIIGICGWGGIALNAAAADPRIKATVASTMYDMSRVTANGYFDASLQKATTTRAITRRRDTKRALQLPRRELPTAKLLATSVRAAWLTRFPMMRRSLPKTTMHTTRRRAAITSVRSIQTTAGQYRREVRSQTQSCLHMSMKSVALLWCCTAKTRTAATWAKTHSKA